MDKLPKEINILSLKPNEEAIYTLNKSQDWVEELLNEINEKVSQRTVEQYLADSELDLELSVKRFFMQPFGSVLLVKGKIEVEYFTECVRTLKEMKDSMSTDFKACFVDNSFAEDPDYEDLDETFVDNDVYEVHFSEKNMADLKEMTHELICLHMNQYPVLDEETPIETMGAASETKQ